MKLLFVLFLCLFANVCFAQLVVDTDISIAYDNAAKKLANESHSKITDIQPRTNNVIFTIFQVDTLNKQELLRQKNMNIDDSGVDRFALINKSEKTLFSLPCGVYVNGDTLDVQIDRYRSVWGAVSTWFNEIIKQKTNVYYSEAMVDVSTRASPPLKVVDFKVSSLNFKEGQTIFGEVEIITSKFSNRDLNFKDYYIDKQLHCKYIFKVTVDKDTFTYHREGYSMSPAVGE